MIFAQCSADYLFYDVQNYCTILYVASERTSINMFIFYVQYYIVNKIKGPTNSSKPNNIFFLIGLTL